MSILGKLQLLSLGYLLLGLLESDATTSHLQQLPETIAHSDISELYNEPGDIWTLQRFYFDTKLTDARSHKGSYEQQKNCILDRVTVRATGGKVQFKRITTNDTAQHSEELEGTFKTIPQHYAAHVTRRGNTRTYMDVKTKNDQRQVDIETGLYHAAGCYIVYVEETGGNNLVRRA